MTNEEDDDDDDDNDEAAKESFAVFVPIASLRSLCSINEILYFRYIKYTNTCVRTYAYMVVHTIVTPRYRIFCICKFSTIDFTVHSVMCAWRMMALAVWRWRWLTTSTVLVLGARIYEHIYSDDGRKDWSSRGKDTSMWVRTRSHSTIFSVQLEFLQIKDFVAALTFRSHPFLSFYYFVFARASTTNIVRKSRVGESERGISHTRASHLEFIAFYWKFAYSVDEILE